MTTDSDEVVNSKQSLRQKKHKLLSKHLPGNGSDDDNETATSSVNHTIPSSEIMNSLSKINSQLGEVLTRLSQPTTNASSIQPYPNNDPLLLSRRPDKTEEELQSKWLHYLGKQVLVLLVIKFPKLNKQCGHKAIEKDVVSIYRSPCCAQVCL